MLDLFDQTPFELISRRCAAEIFSLKSQSRYPGLFSKRHSGGGGGGGGGGMFEFCRTLNPSGLDRFSWLLKTKDLTEVAAFNRSWGVKLQRVRGSWFCSNHCQSQEAKPGSFGCSIDCSAVH